MTLDNSEAKLGSEYGDANLGAAQVLGGMTKGLLAKTLDFAISCIRAENAEDCDRLALTLTRLLPVQTIIGGVAFVQRDGREKKSVVTIRHGQPLVEVSNGRGAVSAMDTNCSLALEQSQPVYWRHEGTNSGGNTTKDIKLDKSRPTYTGFSYVFRTRGDSAAAFLTCTGPGFVTSGPHHAQVTYLMPCFGKALLNCMRGQALTKILALTPREIEVLNLAKIGFTNAEIAAEINAAERTIKFHIENAVRKIGAQNRCQAIGIAVKNGILR